MIRMLLMLAPVKTHRAANLVPLPHVEPSSVGCAGAAAKVEKATFLCQDILHRQSASPMGFAQ